MPIVLIGCLELGLRLSGYGPNLDLFTTEILHGRSYYIMTPEVRLRYFATTGFNPSTSPDYFPVEKSPETFRIFCLGGSTTVGYPYWYNGAFSSFLRDRLTTMFPQKNIEVINIGMTATNSFTVADMAHDVMKMRPDLLVVYDGHNEFYGALGVSSNESPGTFRWMTRAYLSLLHVKSFLLLRDLYGRAVRALHPSQQEISRATMMETLSKGNYVPYGSVVYAKGLRTFEANLNELAAICDDRGIPLLLGTQVSNLKERPPFVSGHQAGLTPALAAQSDSLTTVAASLIDAKSFAPAASLLNSAVRMDSLNANAHYQLARYFRATGQLYDARHEFEKARDYDELRFRASTDFNDAIKRMHDGRRVFVVDLEEVFRRSSQDSLTGLSLLTEHLHPNSRGNFLIGKAYAQSMRQASLLATAAEWSRADSIPDSTLWTLRCVTGLDEMMARRKTDVLTSGWPFKNQIPIVPAVPANDTLGQIVEQFTRGKIDWKSAHQDALTYYSRRGEFAEAAEEGRTIVRGAPLLLQPYLDLARLYLRLGRLTEMESTLLSSQHLEPTILASRALGDLALQTGRPQVAVGHYTRVLSFTQSTNERLENGYLLGLAYIRSGKRDSALAQMQKLLDINPGYAPARQSIQALQNLHE
jgi:tetratricopeptide (TPR) repeat protein